MCQHRDWHGVLLDYPVSKMVCVGNNCTNHIKEMGETPPREPVLFIEPGTTLYDLRQPLVIPSNMGLVHYEVELAVLVDATLRQATKERVHKAIAGYGVALDLTLRDIQGKMKKTGQPWEKAKGFDNFCPLPGFIPVVESNGGPQDAMPGLTVNGEQRQHGTTTGMTHRITPLIAYMSRSFTLKAGDVVLAGTPAGAEPLNSGDELAISFRGQTLTTRVLQSPLAAFSDGKACISVPDWL